MSTSAHQSKFSGLLPTPCSPSSVKLKQVGVINPCCESLELFFLLSCNLCPVATVFLAVVINYRVTCLTSAVNYIVTFQNLISLKKR